MIAWVGFQRPPKPELAIVDLMNPERTASGPAVILIGPPGSGKSTVGPLLAALLDVDFADTDGLIAQRAGKPVGDIFIEDGEDAFRALERSAVPEAIEERRGVVALGSGSVLSPATRDLLARQRVVYLETGFTAVARRSGLAGPHPPIPGNPRGRLRQMLEERRGLYEDVAWLTVPTDDLEPAQIAEEIAAAIAGGGGPGPEPRS
jgi:shikimate kinase